MRHMCVYPTCCIILQRQLCNVKFSERFIVFVVAVCCCNCSQVADRKQLTFNFYAIDYILLHPLRLVCVACVCAPPRDKLESLISETHIYGHTPLQQPQIEGGKQIRRRTTSSKRPPNNATADSAGDTEEPRRTFYVQ
jgi:hypothetical protein